MFFSPIATPIANTNTYLTHNNEQNHVYRISKDPYLRDVQKF